MTARVIHFPVRRRPEPMPPELELVIVTRELGDAEEELVHAREWLRRSRAAGRVRAQADVDECMVRVKKLESRRLRLAGAELGLLRGGLP